MSKATEEEGAALDVVVHWAVQEWAGRKPKRTPSARELTLASALAARIVREARA